MTGEKDKVPPKAIFKNSKINKIFAIHDNESETLEAHQQAFKEALKVIETKFNESSQCEMMIYV